MVQLLLEYYHCKDEKNSSFQDLYRFVNRVSHYVSDVSMLVDTDDVIFSFLVTGRRAARSHRQVVPIPREDRRPLGPVPSHPWHPRGTRSSSATFSAGSPSHTDTQCTGHTSHCLSLNTSLVAVATSSKYEHMPQTKRK